MLLLRRPRFSRILALLLAPALPEAWAQEIGRPATLLWRNGDTLSGDLFPGGEARVQFLAKPFASPFDLSTAPLLGIRFPATDPGPDDEGPGFEFHLRNGDRLLGHLVSIDAERVTLRSRLFGGELRLRRTELVRVARLETRTGGFSGLGSLEQWTSYGRDRKPTDWFTDLRGELATHQWSGNLFRDIDFPEKVEVRFRLHFPGGQPNLQVGLIREAELGPRLETWDDHLVLTHGSRFVPLLKMGSETRDLHLRLFWNQSSGEILVSSASGESLGSLQGETRPPNPDPGRRVSDPYRRGFSILSRNPEMVFVSLEVREWDGSATPLLDLAQPRVEFRGGSPSTAGPDLRLAKDSRQFQVGGTSRPLDDLLEWVLSHDPGKPRGDLPSLRRSTRIAWHAGASLSGAFRQVTPGGIEILPSWSESPLVARTDGMREVRFPETGEAPLAALDTLDWNGLKIRGTLRLDRRPEDAGASLLAWLAPGAASEVPFATGASFKVIRGEADEEAEVADAFAQGRLYLESEEILSGNLIGLDPDKAVFNSRITGRVEVPSARVRAIDLALRGRNLMDFSDSEWEQHEESEDEVTVAEDRVTIRGGSFGNPTLLLGDRIHFVTQWQESYGAMTVRLFAAGADASIPSTDVIIAAQGNRLFIGKLNESGAFSFSGDQIPIVANRASIAIHAGAEKAEVFVNGKSALKINIDPAKVSGNGLYFKMGGGWQGWNQGESSIVISDFRIEQSPGGLPLRVIDPRAKALTLTVPRSFREAPPTQVLIAPNGDLLRGTLVSADSEKLVFNAGGNEIEIPVSRVASIVRLDRPGESEGPPPAPETLVPEEGLDEDADEGDFGPEELEVGGEAAEVEKPAKEEAGTEPAPEMDTTLGDFEVTHHLVLRDGTRLRLFGEGVAEQRLRGKSPVLGTCRVALDQVRELFYQPAVRLADAPTPEPLAFNDWDAVFTPDPKIPDAGETPTSPLIGTEPANFKLSTLGGKEIELSALRGQVVVLDFWATWCGPCVKAIPEVRAAVEAFPAGAVSLHTINQGETPPIIEEFLAAREWTGLPVALDFDMKVGKAFEAKEIPHTVVIDRMGRIAWVHTGMSVNLKKDLFEALVKVLQTP